MKKEMRKLEVTQRSKLGVMLRHAIDAGARVVELSQSPEVAVERYRDQAQEIGMRLLLEARRAGWKGYA